MSETAKKTTRKLRGMTMPELLVVMIVSGIVFLLVFDGLSIIQRYGNLLDRKLSAHSGLLYSHQVLETILEKTDSIHQADNTLLLYMSNDPAIQYMVMDSSYLLFRNAEYTDTLFVGLTNIDLHPVSDLSTRIDSLFISIQMGKDTVKLDYGI